MNSGAPPLRPLRGHLPPPGGTGRDGTLSPPLWGGVLVAAGGPPSFPLGLKGGDLGNPGGVRLSRRLLLSPAVAPGGAGPGNNPRRRSRRSPRTPPPPLCSPPRPDGFPSYGFSAGSALPYQSPPIFTPRSAWIFTWWTGRSS